MNHKSPVRSVFCVCEGSLTQDGSTKYTCLSPVASSKTSRSLCIKVTLSFQSPHALLIMTNWTVSLASPPHCKAQTLWYSHCFVLIVLSESSSAE